MNICSYLTESFSCLHVANTQATCSTETTRPQEEVLNRLCYFSFYGNLKTDVGRAGGRWGELIHWMEMHVIVMKLRLQSITVTSVRTHFSNCSF